MDAVTGAARPLRILHCPEVVGGHAPALARAERALGLDSRSVAFQRSPFGFGADAFYWTPRDGQLQREWARWRLLRDAMRDYDIVHFNFGSGILPQALLDGAAALRYSRLVRTVFNAYARLFELRELAWLKRAGKGICVTYQGDDARQGDWCAAHFAISPAPEVGPGYYTPATDAHKRWRIAQFARHADRIYALNPDLLNVLPSRARFMAYANVDVRAWPRVGVPDLTGRAPVVLHAPSHRGVKGTRFLLAAVERLKAEGVAFEFRLVEGLSHAEAKLLYESADLLVDQLLAGWYGGLAVELMALGKPVVCYLREEDLGFLPAEMRAALPILQATPETIYAVLKHWLTLGRDELAARGRAGRDFVERWHDPMRIAGEAKADYEAIAGGRR